MLALRLPEDLEARLDALARKTGRTKSYYGARRSSSTSTISKTCTSRKSAMR